MPHIEKDKEFTPLNFLLSSHTNYNNDIDKGVKIQFNFNFSDSNRVSEQQQIAPQNSRFLPWISSLKIPCFSNMKLCPRTKFMKFIFHISSFARIARTVPRNRRRVLRDARMSRPVPGNRRRLLRDKRRIMDFAKFVFGPSGRCKKQISYFVFPKIRLPEDEIWILNHEFCLARTP